MHCSKGMSLQESESASSVLPKDLGVALPGNLSYGSTDWKLGAKRQLSAGTEEGIYSLAIDVDMLAARQTQLVLGGLQLESEHSNIVAKNTLLYQTELLLFARIEGNQFSVI